MSNAAMEAKILQMSAQGHDPRRFVRSMAPFFKVTAEEYLGAVDRLAPTVQRVDIHTRAQMNLAQEKTDASRDPLARRAFDHEAD